MTKPLVYLITPGKATDINFVEASREILTTIRLAVDKGVSLIQIREKSISAKLLFELSSRAAKITSCTPTKLLVNDRADIALAGGADGVHLTGRSLRVDVIRRVFPADFMIGVSTHSADETLKAGTSGADFALFGPVFSTPGKGDPIGVAMLGKISRQAAPFPVVAIGGIDGTNCGSVMAADAAGVAGIRAFNDPVALEAICSKLKT